MTEFEKKRLFWLRTAALSAAGILLLVLMIGVGLWQACRTAGRYARQAEAILDTLEEVSEQLDAVDWETLGRAADNVASQLEEADLSEIMARLDTVSAALSAVDWENLASHVDELTLSAQASLEQAREGLEGSIAALEELDIKSLNEAIQNLKAIVEPLANLLGRRG